MCSPSTLQWFERQLTAVEVEGKLVLDVGAYDVNGSLRTVLRPLHPATYVGIDMRSGLGVDVICPAEKLVETFGKHSFDIVVSSSTLEHVHHWRSAITNMKMVCKPGGLILISVPSRWPFHAYPNDYWRYSKEDIRHIFSDCQIITLDEEEGEMALVSVKLRVPAQLRVQTLDGYALYSVVTGTQATQIRRRDYLTRYFAQVLWQTTIRPKIAWVGIYIKMGIKIRLLAPLSRLIRGS